MECYTESFVNYFRIIALFRDSTYLVQWIVELYVGFYFKIGSKWFSIEFTSSKITHLHFSLTAPSLWATGL